MRRESESDMKQVLDTSLLHPGRTSILAYSFRNTTLGETYAVQIGSVNSNGIGNLSSIVTLSACIAL